MGTGVAGAARQLVPQWRMALWSAQVARVRARVTKEATARVQPGAAGAGAATYRHLLK